MSTRYNFSNVRTIMVEKNRFMANILANALEGFGFRSLTYCSRSDQAFHELLNTGAELMIVSWHVMPFDGTELARKIRDPRTSPDPYLPLLMLTSRSERGHVLQARDAGINEFVVKPVAPKVLLDHLLAMVRAPRPFVETRRYFGPDRRRRADAFQGDERRGSMSGEGPPQE